MYFRRLGTEYRTVLLIKGTFFAVLTRAKSVKIFQFCIILLTLHSEDNNRVFHYTYIKHTIINQ